MGNDLVKYFQHAHLSGKKAEVARWYADMAHTLDQTLPDGAEKTVCLRKLLESKDCAVRSALALEA